MELVARMVGVRMKPGVPPVRPSSGECARLMRITDDEAREWADRCDVAWIRVGTEWTDRIICGTTVDNATDASALAERNGGSDHARVDRGEWLRSLRPEEAVDLVRPGRAAERAWFRCHDLADSVSVYREDGSMLMTHVNSIAPLGSADELKRVATEMKIGGVSVPVMHVGVDLGSGPDETVVVNAGDLVSIRDGIAYSGGKRIGAYDRGTVRLDAKIERASMTFSLHDPAPTYAATAETVDAALGMIANAPMLARDGTPKAKVAAAEPELPMPRTMSGLGVVHGGLVSRYGR